jgi:hypothetical protein
LALIITVVVVTTSNSDHGPRAARTVSTTTVAAAGSGPTVAVTQPTATHSSGAVSHPVAGAVSTGLGSVVISAPDGYAVSTSTDVTTGPITAADLDKMIGSPGLTTLLGLVRAYEMVYDSSSASDSIDIALGTPRSAAAATSFVSLAVKAELDTFKDQAPVQQPFASIPGAVEVDGTKLTSDGSLDHEVIAAKGTTFMALDYTTDHVGTAPTVFATWVAAQFARL